MRQGEEPPLRLPLTRTSDRPNARAARAIKAMMNCDDYDWDYHDDDDGRSRGTRKAGWVLQSWQEAPRSKPTSSRQPGLGGHCDTSCHGSYINNWFFNNWRLLFRFTYFYPLSPPSLSLFLPHVKTLPHAMPTNGASLAPDTLALFALTRRYTLSYVGSAFFDLFDYKISRLLPPPITHNNTTTM